ncbi:capsule assembly Wzi family protein [Pelotalea chapellei]|uniref:Capsule assembly Wzi family protein n=1 Tax=Pelotalea chapellei TaxID=44671 RepID=A0ABS5U4M0_9BACT|nr:capsule assembly Wzi family protein [Pelotalea chapellei]MBT1070598.1 capsule assembly Wzi family protein [Pelotalea chapellei]
MAVVRILSYLLFIFFAGLSSASAAVLSSTNIPLDSPVYSYLEKLAGFGLITSDIKGIKPFSKAEAARLLLEAEQRLGGTEDIFARQLVTRIRELMPREVALRQFPDKKVPFFDYNPISSLRLRYVYLDGAPRNYERPVHDPGNDGVFGIGSGLRPKNPYPSPVLQRGSEGAPLSENNNGAVYRDGHNGELRWAVEGYVSDKASGLLEPVIQYSRTDSDVSLKLNRGYLKLGGKWLELEGGKDENWLGLGYRGSITLGNNAENFNSIKISSPEPFTVPYVGAVKYALIGSRFENTITDGVERQPWFYALKLSVKPIDNVEIGFNLGRQVGGPGVKNGIGDTLRGLIGGTSSDNSNGLAGFEARYRIPWLANTELYGEFSGEDTASFWPIVESYLAGFYIPRLTADGRNDLRFEFFQGNQILYTNGTFPEGYLYKNLPIGHSQGGATQDFFTRYSHWFDTRNNLALEYIYTTRGMVGRVRVNSSGQYDPNGVMQSVERKHAGRAVWSLPFYGDSDAKFVYGVEKIDNFNLESGAERTNQLFMVELRYRY